MHGRWERTFGAETDPHTLAPTKNHFERLCSVETFSEDGARLVLSQYISRKDPPTDPKTNQTIHGCTREGEEGRGVKEQE